MQDKLGYLPKEKRKTILLLCDDFRMHSGISTMAREIVLGTAHHFNWINIGAAVNHPEHGKYLDLSQSVNEQTGLTDASVKIIPYNGYGDPTLIRGVVPQEKPDAIMIFTDPRYWIWLFEMEREIRTKIPIFYLNIWDDYPAPKYNENYYDSCDVLMAISKQTKNINEIVLGEKAKSKLIKYVPHGINEDHFFPIEEDHELYPQLQDFRKNTLPDPNIDFVVYFNSRNIQRKRPGDVILAYKHFCDSIGKEKAKKCALIMHTAVVDNNGTDLKAIKDRFCDPEYINIYFSNGKVSTQQMNMLYNISDVTMLISSNEGWGLSLTESMMAGRMIIPNVTGGMQDQARFVDENGKWIDFSADFPSNHRGTYKECGEWAVPVFPSNISLAGSPLTPYIYDDRCQPEDVAQAIKEVYELGPEERKRRGLKAREWVTYPESQMSAKNMCKNVIETLDEGFEAFKPRPRFELVKAGKKKSTYIEHKITGY